MTPVWVTMFITSTLPVIQIVIMCLIGAVLARQVSLLHAACLLPLVVQKIDQNNCAGNPAWSGETAFRAASFLCFRASVDIYKASFIC